MYKPNRRGRGKYRAPLLFGLLTMFEAKVLYATLRAQLYSFSPLNPSLKSIGNVTVKIGSLNFGLGYVFPKPQGSTCLQPPEASKINQGC